MLAATSSSRSPGVEPAQVARGFELPFGLIQVHADQRRLREGEVNPGLLSLAA